MSPIETTPTDTIDVLPLVVRAFADDPLYRWLVPDAAARPEALAAMFGLTLERAAHVGHVDVDPSRRAVAAWTAPGRALLDDQTPFLRLLERWAPDRLDAALAGFTATEAVTPSGAATLHLLAVDPDAQGQGLGSGLVMPRLEAATADDEAVVLSTSRRRNVTYYARFGFEQVAAVPVSDGGPTMHVLRRPAKVAGLDASGVAQEQGT